MRQQFLHQIIWCYLHSTVSVEVKCRCSALFLLDPTSTPFRSTGDSDPPNVIVYRTVSRTSPANIARLAVSLLPSSSTVIKQLQPLSVRSNGIGPSGLRPQEVGTTPPGPHQKYSVPFKPAFSTDPDLSDLTFCALFCDQILNVPTVFLSHVRRAIQALLCPPPFPTLFAVIRPGSSTLWLSKLLEWDRWGFVHWHRFLHDMSGFCLAYELAQFAGTAFNHLDVDVGEFTSQTQTPGGLPVHLPTCT
ncbi:hypothetical protein JVT61DRAFT_9521 [Boletus reticuloceps]|uniref:Uncharacterized protein n=1 Tax=Boletus reticuloceps TaxID=495285 RepID=A0A8I2YGD4_9AGAM|nr:hypothetical protein JVT61DRAFT_9521 [Boletus reticuloceps]